MMNDQKRIPSKGNKLNKTFVSLDNENRKEINGRKSRSIRLVQK